jgi:hypothetical protein
VVEHEAESLIANTLLKVHIRYNSWEDVKNPLLIQSGKHTQNLNARSLLGFSYNTKS